MSDLVMHNGEEDVLRSVEILRTSYGASAVMMAERLHAASLDSGDLEGAALWNTVIDELREEDGRSCEELWIQGMRDFSREPLNLPTPELLDWREC
ncbi:MAG: hypothetical protein QNJ92_07980 [Alphaproteobacteria bacterium]|nr:hypothetical protein [Alphaproteobacteria bacterium]